MANYWQPDADKYMTIEEELETALEAFGCGKVAEGVDLIKSLRGRPCGDRVVPSYRPVGPGPGGDGGGCPKAG